MLSDTPPSTSRVSTFWKTLPKPAKIISITAATVIVIGAIAVPVTANSVDQHNKQVVAEQVRADKAVAKQAAAELAAAQKDATTFNAGFEGFTVSLATAVNADAATEFDAARAKLAVAIKTGDIGDIAKAQKVVDKALSALVQTAKAQADAAISAAPIADQAAKDALLAAVSNLSQSTDVKAGLTEVKAATDALAAAQAAAQAAADAAAQQSGGSYSGGSSSGGSYSGGGNSSSGGGSASGGSTSSGGGSTSDGSSGGGSSSGGAIAAPAIDHTPRVTANGDYRGGCDGIDMYSQETSSGGGIIINVTYPYYYTTYSTSDGWGLTVYGCEE